jgi:D-serine dehydratase
MEVSLKEYIESRMDEREKAHAAQIQNAERNLTLAADQLRERLERMNEFRRQIDGERALYVSRDQLDGILASRAATVGQALERIERLEKWQENLNGRLIVFGLAVVAMSGIIVAALRLVGH